eukprot:GDKJ01042462.1.p1 GENE.GDKJ01042462.1~~GDKJ01042462.1.p1  ORF type:complete len:374 (-),score=97.19 GDKJ01042462.1:1091-2212(-)
MAADLENTLQNRPTTQTCVMIGAPFADGQTLGGVEKAPQALRDGGLPKIVRRLGWNFEDRGDIPAERAEIDKSEGAATGAAEKVTRTFGEDENPYETNVKHPRVCGANNKNLYELAYTENLKGNFVLTVGGDHGLASGSIGAHLRARPNLAVIWVDAHGDCNTPETSPSGNYHGMPLAHLLGWFNQQVRGFEWLSECPTLPEHRLALIALRDLDDSEKQMLAMSEVACFSMKDVDRFGISGVMEKALAHVDPENDRPIHLSLDIDAVDPSIAPGTGTKARGGLTFREIHYICETLADTSRLCSMDLVEINPTLDPENKEEMHGDDPDNTGTMTVALGIDLVASALGKNILHTPSNPAILKKNVSTMKVDGTQN